jgi:hypothetical protein
MVNLTCHRLLAPSCHGLPVNDVTTINKYNFPACAAI